MLSISRRLATFFPSFPFLFDQYLLRVLLCSRCAFPSRLLLFFGSTFAYIDVLSCLARAPGSVFPSGKPIGQRSGFMITAGQPFILPDISLPFLCFERDKTNFLNPFSFESLLFPCSPFLEAGHGGVPFFFFLFGFLTCLALVFLTDSHFFFFPLYLAGQTRQAMTKSKHLPSFFPLPLYRPLSLVLFLFQLPEPALSSFPPFPFRIPGAFQSRTTTSLCSFSGLPPFLDAFALSQLFCSVPLCVAGVSSLVPLSRLPSFNTSRPQSPSHYQGERSSSVSLNSSSLCALICPICLIPSSAGTDCLFPRSVYIFNAIFPAFPCAFCKKPRSDPPPLN